MDNTRLVGHPPLDGDTRLAEGDRQCLLAVANALIVDQGLITFLRELAPQWGASTGKTRSYNGLLKVEIPAHRCILRVDSRTAILLDEALYRPEGPSPLAGQLAEALRRPRIDPDGLACRIEIPRMPAFTIAVIQYADAEGLPVAPDSPELHHRVVSIMPLLGADPPQGPSEPPP